MNYELKKDPTEYFKSQIGCLVGMHYQVRVFLNGINDFLNVKNYEHLGRTARSEALR